MKLKSKSRAATVLSFHHDCYRFLFFGKGRPSKDGKSTMLEKDDFARCNIHDLWEQCLDKLGDGVRIKFPVKIHITLFSISRWHPVEPTKDAPWETYDWFCALAIFNPQCLIAYFLLCELSNWAILVRSIHFDEMMAHKINHKLMFK